jgi:hypothetical protein
MHPVPSTIDGAVVLWFTPIDDSHRYTGNCRHEVRGVLLGPASGLAICQYRKEGGFYLFYCDENWNTLTDTYHESVERAQEQAEFEYEGTTQTWQEQTGS